MYNNLSPKLYEREQIILQVVNKQSHIRIGENDKFMGQSSHKNDFSNWKP